MSASLDRLRYLATDPLNTEEMRVEAGTIADMLVPLGAETRPDGSSREVFTCRHHDATTGDCQIYERRPKMCRDYPYGKPCNNGDCTGPDRKPSALVELRR